MKEKSKKAKETYVDDPDQLHAAILLSAETKGVAEFDDKPYMSPDAQLLIDFKKGSKLSRQERLIQELSEGPGEGSMARNETQDDRNSLDRDKTLSTPRLEIVVDEGDEDDASNFTVFVHGKQYNVNDKERPIHTTISSPRTRLSHDNVSRYLNKTPAPSLEDVGLPRIARTSGLNSHDKSSRKENPRGDSIDLDWLIESQTVIVPEVTMTEPTGPDQRGSTIVNPEMHLTPGETPTLGLLPGQNPELTRCTSCASKNPSNVLAQNLNFQIVTNARRFNPMAKQFKALQEKVEEQQRKMDEFIADKVLSAVQESFSAQVIRKSRTMLQHCLTTTPALTSTNITIPQLKARLYKMMSNNPETIQGDINNHLYIALSKFVEQDKQAAPKDSCRDANSKKRTHDDQDDPKNLEGEKRHKK
ncbi:hypothetical protein Tco_0217022 [Tanacetum coccineum]